MPQRQKIRDSPIAESPSSSDPLCGRDRHRHSGWMNSRAKNTAVVVAAIGVILTLVVIIVVMWTGYRGGGASFSESTTRSPLPATKGLLLGEPNDQFPSTGIESPTSTSELTPTTQSPGRRQLSIGETLGDHHRMEKVRPIKLPPPIEEEVLDLQGEEPPPRLRHERHHHTSNHFRARTPGLWDPHPRYAFSAFGRRFRLDLTLGAPFLSPHLRVTTQQGREHNEMIRENKPAVEEHERCFYTGTVYGDPSSSVAVNLCHGMTGHIRTADGSFFIEPMETWAPQSPTTLHAIYRVSRPKLPPPPTSDRAPAEPLSSCGVDESMQKPKINHKKLLETDDDLPDHSLMSKEEEEEEYEDEDDEDDIDEDDEEEKDDGKEQKRKKGENSTIGRGLSLRRSKRSTSEEYFVEVMVVADRKMMEYHKGELINYVLTLMSIVSSIYKDASIGNPMTITVVKLIQSNEDFTQKAKDSYEGTSAPEMLKKFCEWQSKMNTKDDGSPEHHDTALLLTRENICRNPLLNKCDTLGLAELGTMCDHHTSCAIVQDNGLSASFTIAHELGHVLNMPHDDDARCKQFLGGTRVHNVMSRMLDHNTRPWSWSNCSRHFMTDFLESGRSRCLEDPPPVSATSTRKEEKLPGEIFIEDRQCEFVFGPGSKICSYMPVCGRLWCTTALGEEKEGCRTQHMPWADGTSCAKGMWCQKGECVQQNRSALQPVDGGWSGWERWGPCSRSCGGGIKKSERACSSPAPSNGGKYCVGERVRFKSCRKMDCPVGSRDFREVQCAQFNNNTFSIPDVPPDVKWVPSYSGISDSDRCKLFCRISHSGVHYLLGDKVKDGTTCDRDTYDVCINGVCHKADCSHTIKPIRPLDVDICGKCGGDNSTCRMVRGEYNVSSYGYRRVVLIPAGSYNLDIKQSGHRGTSKDDNYLALVNPDTGDYLLNGNFIVSLFRKLIVYGVTRIEYSGSNAATERINSSGPLSKDLILEVLSVGKLYPPNIYYQYTVQHSRPEYRWELRPEWTRCSSECHGEQFKRPICIKDSTGYGEIVMDDLCSPLTRPRHLVQRCNTHCILRWKVAHETPCLAHTCTKTRTVECVREVPSRNGGPSQVQAVDQEYCKHLAGKPQYRISCQMSCRAEWKPTEWSPCSATCGEGIQRRKFVCMDSNGQETVPKFCKGGKHHGPEEQKCKVQECPRWATGEWTPCSVTCGSGEQQRPYWCELEGKAVAEGYCRSHVGDSNGIPVHVQKCKALPCPYLSDRENWIQEEAPLPTAHPSSSSSPLVSPTTALALPRTPAPPPSRWSHNPDHRNGYLPSLPVPRSSPNFRWRAGLWGPCTQTCREEGGSNGYLRRLVACHDEHGRDADDSLCPHEEKPLDVIPCQLPICPKWVHGEWGPCNVSCGEGRQFREVRCRGSEGQALAETKCSPFKKPLSTKVCAAASCPTWQSPKPRQREPKFMWNAWHWEKCSTTCGPGFQRRKVACVRVSRSGSGDPEPLEPLPAGPGPPHYCHASLKPVEHQRCQISECGPQFRWKTGRWKPCSEPCGKKGKQRRVVSCIRFKPDGQTKRVPKLHCPQSSKPHSRQKCNRHSCDYSSCELIREAKWRQHGRNLNLRDGEYHLLISGVSIPIYCHGMGIRTNLPKEYLTLPAGERDNFSEFYDRRLLNPNTCPDGGLRRDDCDCTIDSNGKGGVTVFSRLRINVTSLKIDTSDMTFARQLQGSKVAFGRAGDCYSSLDCPQGRFSINLVGTRLRVHEDVKWEGSGPSASVHIDRRENGQSIIGRCGGYCGACQPAGAPWIALDILPARNEGGLR